MYKPIKKQKIFAVLFLLLTFYFNDVLIASEDGKIKQMQYQVFQVKDGDTVVLRSIDKRQSFTCRLYGIDAPEKSSKNKKGMLYGEESTEALKEMILGQFVDVIFTGQKTYNRNVCIIFKNNENINLKMVKQGWAWAYIQYLNRPHISKYIHAENEARKYKLGLWKQNNPIPPWEWRKKHK